MRKSSLILMIILLVAIFMVDNVLAAPFNQDPWGEIYIVQADDWLSKIADKFYGNVFAYPAIVEATNIKGMTDDTFAIIDDPDLINVGQKLLIPNQILADQIMASATVLDEGDVTTFKYFVHPDIGTYEFKVRWRIDGWVDNIEIYDAQHPAPVQTINFTDNVYDRNSRLPDSFLEALDYNFDGYKDIGYVAWTGARSVYDTHIIWLFDLETKQFVLNETLSSLQAVYPLPEKKEIVSHIWDPTSEAFRIYQYREQAPVLVREVEKCLMAEEYCVEYLDKAYQGDVTDLINLTKQSWGVGQDFGVLRVSEPDEGTVCLSIFVPDETASWWSYIGEQVVVQGDAAKCKAAEDY